MNEPTDQGNRDQLTPDQKAAHQFLTELRTRITTQPLPYQFGVEARALESLWEVFGQARQAIKANPGCEEFAASVTHMLNVHLRPVTAKWHRAYVEGRLDSRDGADEFRGDLAAVQAALRAFAEELHAMAYGQRHADDLTPPAISAAEIESDFAPLRFGIPEGWQVPSPTATDVNTDEAREVAERRRVHAVKADDSVDAAGLALSGGGIRSASFSLGVVQVLAERQLLKDVDFLSTVSGGGYTGSFLTRRLGDSTAADPEKLVAAPHGPDTDAIRYLRLRAKFLTARNLKESWSMVVSALAGMLLNWTAPLWVILVAAILTSQLGAELQPSFWAKALGVFGVLSAVALVGYGYALRWGRHAATVNGGTLGAVTALTTFIGICWVTVLVYGWLTQGIEMPWRVTGAAAGLIAVGPAMIRFLPILEKPAIRKLVLRILLWAAAVLVPLTALATFYAAWWVLDPWNQCRLPLGIPGLCIVSGVAICAAAISLLVLNINLTGLHRIYRDGLASTFVQTSDKDDPAVPLHAINRQQQAPYHLLNATLNLPSSEHIALRDRRCDFFLFSKNWSGAPAIGYFKTDLWKANGQALDLPTAMAVSGAAVSAHMGLGSLPTLTALMALLNLRLGFWIRKPGTRGSAHPGFSCLLREMLGVGMSENDDWLNLTDGGHIENMAVYELLRRRCKFIVCVDGEADPEFTFGGLLTLVRHAQIDFGIEIDSRLDEIRPSTSTGHSKSHYQFCRIRYPEIGHTEAGTGFLLYLKLSVTGNESELIQRYRKTHPEFPHQTTLDQFFDEEQFEAYRQLGVHVAEGLFSPALMNRRCDPLNVVEWFRRLAGNLLLPQ